MKQLTISLKTSRDVLNNFKTAYEKVKSQKLKSPHYEVSFDNKADFDRFIKNIHILSDILAFKPKSLYELAKISGMDVSNLNKIILFFEEIDVIRIQKTVVSGRTVKTPIVDYDRIEFKLAA
jgi:predicted transcriptional regulator